MSADRLEAIVVGMVNYGEADRIVRLLTPNLGRVDVLARRARSSKRRFGGAIEAGNEIVVHLEPRRRTGLWILKGVDLVRAPTRARKELHRLGMLTYGCEVCSVLAPEHHEAAKLFRLLQVWLALLEGDWECSVDSRLAFEAKALTFAGLAPALTRCAHCGELIHEPAVFQVNLGGAIHGHCGGGRAVKPEMLQQIERLRRMPLAETVGQRSPKLVSGLLSDLIEAHIGKALRSRAFLEETSQ